MKKSLTEIAYYYGTDKGTEGPSQKWNPHNYTDIYEPYLENFRESHINFLEIGLGVTGENWRADIVHGKNSGGASIKMWHEYFSNAKIFGIDINECSFLNNDRIKTFVIDQGNIKQLDYFIEKSGIDEFDFIIDDGSHIPDHQQTSFSYFFKKLKKGGLYIIEDLLANGISDYKSGRMSSNKVVNTRNVLKQFCLTGKFSTPNMLSDEAYLASNIDWLRFHAPEKSIKYEFGKSIFHPILKKVYYKKDSEKVCVIKKK